MGEWLYGIDLALFRVGNSTLTFGVGDWFFPFVTDIKNFRIPYLIAMVALIVFTRKRGLVAVLLLGVTILLSDQLSSQVIKPLVGRMRPCHVLEGVRLLVDCGPGKSFPSSHAVNNFAMAVLVGHFFRRARPWLLVWAALVAWSRVYVGVHYPADVFGGALIGSALAFVVILLWEAGERRFTVWRRGREAVNGHG